MWRKAFTILSARKRWQALPILMCMIASSFFETVGVASVVPFLAVLEDPTKIETNGVLAAVYRFGGFQTQNDFLIVLGIFAFCLLFLAALVRAASYYIVSRFVQACRLEVSSGLLRSYMLQPYGFFLNRHSGDLSNIVLSETDNFIEGALTPMAQVISTGLMLVALVGLLIYVDPVTALTASLFFGGIYVIIYRVIRNVLTRSGAERLAANKERFMVTSEALSGIKHIKIMGLELGYVSRFARASEIAARSLVFNSTLGQMPRYVIEAAAFGGIILLATLLTLREDGGAATVLPVLGLYAFSAYKMLPSVQTLYQSLGSLRFARPIVDRISEEMALGRTLPPTPASVKAMPLRKELRLEGVGFRYPPSPDSIATETARRAGISNVSFTLPAGQSLGIIGTTGAGKTTLVDVILGLLAHTSGRITVDGVELTPATLRGWQDRLGYVPQDIYLSQASVAENIAFGLAPDQIDHARVVEVAKLARIDEFISKDLPNAYATLVGERGVRLSGGQRQRIGIARALYRDPDLIVFDEATSALDSETESAVMQALNDLAGRKTLIIVAHRLTTISRCDQVIRLERGEIVEQSSGAQHAL